MEKNITTSASIPDKRREDILFLLYQVYKWILFFPLLGIITVVMALIAFPAIWLFGQRSGQVGGIFWSRLSSLVTPMTVKVHGEEKIDPKQSYVVVANHQSQYDIFAVYGWLPVDFRWVLKQELRKVPIIGVYCEKAGHVYIDRSDTESALASINRAKERITGGTSIFFFAEGTRSLTGELLPFKKGAFKFALDLELPILPVTIRGTRDVLPANTIDLFPGSAELIIHDPIAVDSYSEETMNDLISQTRDTIASGLTEQQKD